MQTNSYEKFFLPLGGCLLGVGERQGFEGAGLLLAIFSRYEFTI